MTTATEPKTKTKRLTPAQRGHMESIRDHHLWPNAIRWNEADAGETPGGRLVAGWRETIRRSRWALVDQGLVEVVRAEGYAFACGTPAAGIVRVTTKGIAALESGRYEPETDGRVAPQARRESGFGAIRGDRDPRPPAPIDLFTGFDDNGPCEPGSPSAFCPHCGSGGRYVYTFLCSDGTRRGAMKGCIKLFPVSRLAAEQMAALDRVKDCKARHRRPASWDVEVEALTDQFDLGLIGADEAKGGIEAALRRRAEWRARNGNGRRR